MLERRQKFKPIVGSLVIFLLGCLSFWHWSSLQVDYSKLEKLLSTHQWIEADVETSEIINRLLLKTIDDRHFFGFSRLNLYGEKLRVLYSEDNGLPCEDLEVLDQLWSKYSDGKFGFDVQSDISLSISRSFGYLNEEYIDERIVSRFEDKIGWNWDYYDKPSLDNPNWYNRTLNSQEIRGFLPSLLWALSIEAEKSTDTYVVLKTLNHFRKCSISLITQ